MSTTPSAASPAAPPAATSSSTSVWKEYKNAEGRSYWFHSVDKRSVWEKPDELKTPRERAIASTRWKEYKAESGRQYYVHSDTKETTWTVPQELQVLFDSLPDSTPAAVSPGRAVSATASPAPAASPSGAEATTSSTKVAPGPPPVAPPQLGNLTPTNGGPPRQIYAGPPPGFGPGPPPGAPPVRPPPSGPAAGMATPPGAPGVPAHTGPAPSNQRFATPHDAFRFLLQSHGISATATWEQTMRDLITDPLYKSLRTVADRKAVFHEHQAELRRRQEEEKGQRKAELRPAVTAVLRSAAKEDRLKNYSSWRTVMKVVGQHADIKTAISAIGEEECESFWTDVKKELKAVEEASIREMRHRNMDLLMSLLRTFEADTTTRWRDAHRTVLESSEWKQDAHLSQMEVQDMLIVFEEYIRGIEREETDRRKEEEKQRVRAERKRREEFRKLMAEGREAGWIHSKTTWPQVYKRLKEDERFLSMLGQKGSTPLDLFFDTIDACDRSIEARTASVEALIKLGDRHWEGVKEMTTWDDFLSLIRAGLDRAGENRDEEKWSWVAKEDTELRLVYEELHQTASRIAREERKRHERHIRHLIDDARYGLKKSATDELLALAEEGVPLDRVRDSIEQLKIREWRKLEDEISSVEEREEVRTITWEKFCRRQKEKAEERLARGGGGGGGGSDRRGGGGGGGEEGAILPSATSTGHSRRSVGLSDDGRPGSESTRKRKSDGASYSNGHAHGGSGDYEERDRERDRSRRREDRDRRRGGYEESLSGREKVERGSRRREEGEDGEIENDRKRSRVDLDPSTRLTGSFSSSSGPTHAHAHPHGNAHGNGLMRSKDVSSSMIPPNVSLMSTSTPAGGGGGGGAGEGAGGGAGEEEDKEEGEV